MDTMDALCSIAHTAREDEVRDCLQQLPSGVLGAGRVGIVACQRAIKSNPDVGVCRAFLEQPEIRRNVNLFVPANCSGGAPTTLLRAAVLRGADFVRLLLALPEVDLNLVCSDGSTPLHLACSMSRDEVLPLLLNDRRVDLAATTLDHRTALHCACEREGNTASCVDPDKKLTVVRMLVKAAAAETLQFLNKRDSRGRTALHYAAKNNHAPVVQELLDADVRASDTQSNSTTVLAQDSQGRMAVHLAAKKGHQQVVRLLLWRAPNTLLCQDDEALTPLQHAVRSGHLLILQDWCPRCVSPLQSLLETFLKLLKATTHNEVAVFLLKELGQQLQAPSSLTRWAIESRSGYGAALILHILKWQPHLANEILDQERNQTPLHVATISGQLDVVQALCTEQGWSLITNRKDKYNKTALDYAHDLNDEHLSEHLAQRADTKEYVTKLQRERDAYVAGANAILIVAVLIAGASFVSCVKPDTSTSPPLQSAPTSPLHLMIQTTFLTSMAATTLGACASLPFSFGSYTGSIIPTSRCHSDYIGHKVGRVRVLVALASYFLLSSLASMVYSFLCASELGVSADVRSLRACKVFTVTLASVTLLVLAAFLGRAQFCKSKQLKWRNRMMSRRESNAARKSLAIVRQDSAPELSSKTLAFHEVGPPPFVIGSVVLGHQSTDYK